MTTDPLAPIDVRLQLAALWTATLGCYVYGDYFELYVPGKLADMQAGLMGPLGAVNQGVLLGTALLMLLPCLMIALPLLLPPRMARGLHGVVGAAYTGLMLLIATQNTWHFYRLLAVVEAALTATVVWLAWRHWPVREARHVH